MYLLYLDGFKLLFFKIQIYLLNVSLDVCAWKHGGVRSKWSPARQLGHAGCLDYYNYNYNHADAKNPV